MKQLGITLVCLTVFAGAHGAFAQQPSAEAAADTAAADEAAANAPAPPPPPKSTSMDSLLKRVKAGWNGERKENRDREASFSKAKADQQRLLNEAKATRAALERRSEALETQFEGNELALTTLEDTLTERLGALGELFGVVRQVSGDTRSQIEGSLVSAQIPGREEFLEELGKNKSLPSIEALEKLWFVLHQEMTELGKVIRFSATVISIDGEQNQRDVIRVGAFNVVSDGVYLIYEDRKLQELPKQPAGSYLDTVPDFEEAAAGSMGTLALDPSRGSILKVLIQTPGAMERIAFGGKVGYTIIALGLLAGFLAIIRGSIVFMTGRKVAAQKKSNEINTDNPLGRVLGIYEENRTMDVETLELKLDEVIMRESASLDKLLWVVKVVSVVAPLMGLLGTVTGLIRTFQAITLFGTGDPKMMASGISEALVTTMLGLFVAIPMVLLHALVSNTSKGVVEVLEEQAAGLIARRAEQRDVS
jgi:biopolymer transport protein ExbB